MRTLAILCVSLACAVFLSYYFVPRLWLLPLFLLSLLVYGLLLTAGGGTGMPKRRNAAPEKTTGAALKGRRNWKVCLLITLGAALGFGLFLLQWHRVSPVLTAWDGTERTVQVRVLEYPQTADHYTRLHAELTESPRLGVMLYDYGAVLATDSVEYTDSSEEIPGSAEESPEVNEENFDRAEEDPDSVAEQVENAEQGPLPVMPGDLLSVRVKFRRADLRYGERNDSYVSKDIWLTGTLRSASAAGRRADIRTIAAVFSRTVSERVGELFPGSTGVFMRSLMLGDKTDFYRDLPLYASMRGAGFMHIVAVSGMHIAFLAGLLQLLFGARPLPSAIGILLIWGFVLLTGASPSAVRAALMQSVLLMAPIFRRENDGPTSLSFALALILCLNPFSCASISLQLSFSAMAGMILLAEPLTAVVMQAFRIKKNSRLRVPVATIAASVAVLAASTPFSVLHFGTLALYSPLTNLLGLLAVPLCFLCGWVACLLSFLIPAAGQIGAFPAAILARFLMRLTSAVHRLPHSLIGMRTPQMLLWLGLCYVLGFLAWMNRRAGSRARVLLPTGLALLSLVAGMVSARQRYAGGEAVAAAMDVGQGECVCLLSGDRTVVFDCGGLGNLDNAGETAATWLESAGRSRVDLLVLSHLHEDHANGVPMLLELIPVKTIVYSPDAETDVKLLPEILESAARHGVDVRSLKQDETVDCGKIRLKLFAPPETGSGNERCIISLASVGDFDMLVTGDAPAEAELSLIAAQSLPDTELLIVGHHGSLTSSDESFLQSIRAEEAVISVGRNNSYGHPAWETLERLRAAGMRVHRTDLNGTVEFRIA